MKISYIGRFERMHDEEYIARSFEMLGHEVFRNEIVPDYDILLFAKWDNPDIPNLRNTVCWVFDLYWDYVREFRVKTAPFFQAKNVFTTDGGHAERWLKAGIKHKVVRQGIYKPECEILPGNPEGIVFVGQDNPANQDRSEELKFIIDNYANRFRWYGRYNTHDLRGTRLNKEYGNAQIVIGSSVYSPHYWSNRVVETLGRGGFLIHQEVAGIRKEYPFLVTYERGNFDDLKEKIEYYTRNEAERQHIVELNHRWVRDHYTMDKKCDILLKSCGF